MYSLISNKEADLMLKGVDDRYFTPSCASAANNTLHFFYRLVDLQKEIEKRTFYLGKYRNAEGAKHLMDLIGMSRDENDLLYPFAKAAMADVFDQLNANTLHIPKKYQWSDAKTPISIRALPASHTVPSTDLSGIRFAVTEDGSGIIIAGTYTDTTTISSDQQPTLSIQIQYETTYKILGASGTTIRNTSRTVVNIPSDHIHNTSGTSAYLVAPFIFYPELSNYDSSITSKEEIDATSITAPAPYGTVQPIWKEPAVLCVGDIVVDSGGVRYEVLVETDENNIDLSKDAKTVSSNETIVEGINYWLSVPYYLNLVSVEPLDNALLEALVNRVIWKWLVLSYPSEAAVYDTLYQDNIKSITLRCNIFNKNWRQVPRIL